MQVTEPNSCNGIKCVCVFVPICSTQGHAGQLGTSANLAALVVLTIVVNGPLST